MSTHRVHHMCTQDIPTPPKTNDVPHFQRRNWCFFQSDPSPLYMYTRHRNTRDISINARVIRSHCGEEVPLKWVVKCWFGFCTNTHTHTQAHELCTLDAWRRSVLVRVHSRYSHHIPRDLETATQITHCNSAAILEWCWPCWQNSSGQKSSWWHNPRAQITCV